MNRTVYQEPRTFLKYDDQHIIGYLNEEVVENYVVPDNGTEENAEPVVWPTAYAYTGTETDGGTIMPCTDLNNYGEMANAIIRSRYSVSQELAIQRHAINGDYAEAGQEYEDYNDWCQQAVATAKRWVLGQ